MLRGIYLPLCGGGATHATPRQKWQIPWVLASHLVHNGVDWLGAHVSSGMRWAAKQYSQKQPVIMPQSTHGLQNVAWSPPARRRTTTGSWSLEAKLVLGVCDVDQSFGPSLSCELFVPDLANFISQMADSINS